MLRIVTMRLTKMRLVMENPLRISTIRDTVVCPVCQLSQFERGSGKCRRCHNPLGISYIEMFLKDPTLPFDCENTIALQLEIGGLLRRLRSRLDLTQAEVAALTGIHRTYLSRVERGVVLPSLMALLKALTALSVDKIVLRVRG